MKLKLHYAIIVAAIAFLAFSCNRHQAKNTTTSGSMTMFCDDSFENIMEQEIDVFEYIYPNAKVLVRYGTQTEALDSLMSLNTRTIAIPRDITAKEKAALKKKGYHARSAKIAVDAVALIVNPENPTTFLSSSEITGILSGEIPSWRDLNPHYPDTPITVVFDDARSSMVQYMTDSLLNGKPVGPTAAQTGSIKGVIDAVKSNKNAIGVIGVSWLTPDLRTTTTIDSLATDLQDSESVAADMGEINEQIDNSGVKVLGVMRPGDRRAYFPYQQNIYDGTYPLTRQMYMITVASTSSVSGGFYSFVTGFVGQKLIMKTGVMPAIVRRQIAEITE